MAERKDRDSQTEDASEKRVNESVERGDAPVSREVSAALFLVALGAALAGFASHAASSMAVTLARLLEDAPSRTIVQTSDARTLIVDALLQAAGPVLALPFVLMTAGLVAHIVQAQPRVVADRIAPDASRISPLAGLARLFSTASLVEFAKAIVKLGVVAGICWSVLVGGLPAMLRLADTDPLHIPGVMLALCTQLTLWIAMALAALAALDVLAGRWRWRRGLMMTKDEVRQEHKESEGDPVIRARRMSVARARSRRRMMAAVPTATVLIVNPTHYAVALRYVRSESQAPKMVAKGRDLVALRIRELAERSGVPVVENKSLARALYAQVEIEQVIPREFYRAVADIIIALQKARPRR